MTRACGASTDTPFDDGWMRGYLLLLESFRARHSYIGRPLNSRTVEQTFRRLCAIARIRRESEALYQPRLDDLRHTFAVHRIVLWHRQQASMSPMLPLLAAYMGFKTMNPVEKYLLLAPTRYVAQTKKLL